IQLNAQYIVTLTSDGQNLLQAKPEVSCKHLVKIHRAIIPTLDDSRPSFYKWKRWRPLILELIFRQLVERLVEETELLEDIIDLTLSLVGKLLKAVAKLEQPVGHFVIHNAANGISPKFSQAASQQKPLPYSVETPYGFHLDLDFLKYVNDIEQGNTIKRVPIQRRNKGPKFSTLPRNFSLPAHTFRSASQTDVWALPVTFGPSSKTQSMNAQQIFGFQACESGFVGSHRPSGTGHTSTKAVKDASIKAFDEQPLASNFRPQLLRAASMPATILQRKNSELDDEKLQGAKEISEEDENSENVFCSSNEEDRSTAHKVNSNLEQQLTAALQRIRDLEEQVQTIPKLKAQIRTLKEEKEQYHFRNSQRAQQVDPVDLQRADSSQLGSDSRETSSTADTGAEQPALHLTFEENTQQTNTQQEASRELDVPLESTLTQKSKQMEEEVKNLLVLDQHKEATQHSPLQNVNEGVKKGNVPFKSVLISSDHTPVGIGALQAKFMALEKKYVESSMELDRVNALLSKQMLENKLMEEQLKQNVGKTLEKQEADQEICISAEPRLSPDHDNTYKTVVNTCCEQKTLIDKDVSVDEELRSASTHFNPNRQLKDLTSTSTQTDDPKPGEKEVNVPDTDKLVDNVDVTSNTAAGTDSREDKGAVMRPVYSGSQHNMNPECVKETGREVGHQSQCDGRHLEEETCSWGEMDSAAISHLVAQIEDLLQKQWDCLSGGTPESTLKSIMKKNATAEHSASRTAKKNLKFVGVNGGYETTSSEDSSEEENMEADISRPEKQKKGDGDGDGDQEELANETVESQRITMESPAEQPGRQALSSLYQKWFLITSRGESQPDIVALHLSRMGAATTPDFLRFVVNLADGNGNTALHYSASHANFHVVKLLLDTDLCEVDHQNKAGYTAIMLASLAATESAEDMGVARQLMKRGHVDARASQAGQTALMLAASHGRTAMVHLLLDCGANPNVQDHSGSTALMCACEHGHGDIVRLLLDHPDCDPGLTDAEGRSALSVATTAAHLEIVDLLEAHADAGASDTAQVEKKPIKVNSRKAYLTKQC
ncbi:KN motif and ankyrin repeat domain-containing protein 4-like, partial [Scleropages formosus]